MQIRPATFACSAGALRTCYGTTLKGRRGQSIRLNGVRHAQFARQNPLVAATRTMQLVRQALAYSDSTPQEVVDATSDTVGRKLREMRYALAVEKQLTKDEILERYLNIAPFGHGTFGIYAAAEVYFGKAPKDLTLGEAALLAGLVKAPTAYDPMTDAGHANALDRRDNVRLGQMVTNGDPPRAGRAGAVKGAAEALRRPPPARSRSR